MAGYTKLFSSITDSTIWQAPDATRLVWITMLAMADQNGQIEASVPGLADRARVSLPACVEALKELAEPDEWSRTKEYDGRRITEIDGGWVLLNHAKYRAIRDAEDRREQSRLAMARLRADRKSDDDVSNVSHGEPPLTQAEAEASTKAGKAKATGQQAALAGAGFAEFWNLYPLKKGKSVAENAWKKIKPADRDAIMEALPVQVADDDEWQRGFIPRASTYLNGQRWADEISKPKPNGASHGQPKETYAARITRKALAERASAALDSSERPDDAGPVDLDVGVLLGTVVKQIR